LHVLAEPTLTFGNLPIDFLSDSVQAHAHPIQNSSGNTVGLSNQAQEQMLGGNKVFTKPSGFLLSKENNSARSFSKPLPHFTIPPSLWTYVLKRLSSTN
jgi:hypothetical protein